MAVIGQDDDGLLRVLEELGPPADEELLRKCLTGQFPKSAMHLIKKDKENNQTKGILFGLEKASIIFEAQEEEVIIEIMKTYNKESCKKTVVPGTQENLLHFFIIKRFDKAL